MSMGLPHAHIKESSFTSSDSGIRRSLRFSSSPPLGFLNLSVLSHLRHRHPRILVILVILLHCRRLAMFSYILVLLSFSCMVILSQRSVALPLVVLSQCRSVALSFSGIAVLSRFRSSRRSVTLAAFSRILRFSSSRNVLSHSHNVLLHCRPLAFLHSRPLTLGFLASFCHSVGMLHWLKLLSHTNIDEHGSTPTQSKRSKLWKKNAVEQHGGTTR
jgi:hypothetical protein